MALIYLDAFSKQAIKMLESRYELMPISQDELPFTSIDNAVGASPDKFRWEGDEFGGDRDRRAAGGPAGSFRDKFCEAVQIRLGITDQHLAGLVEHDR